MFASVAALIAISTRDDQPLPKEVENSVELSPLQSQRNRATQFDLKGRVELQTLKSLGAFKCQSTCTYGGDCIGNQKSVILFQQEICFGGRIQLHQSQAREEKACERY